MYKSELKHYGVSIRDGAPGPGTGNYDRGGYSYRMRVRNMEHAHEYSKFTRADEKKYTEKNPIEDLKSIKRISEGSDLKEIRHSINTVGQEYGRAGRYYNCQNCAVAFDMVERGYDVHSRPKPNGSNVGDIESYFKGGKLTNLGISDYDTDYLESYDRYKNTPSIFAKKRSERFMYNHDQIAQSVENNVVSSLKKQGNGSRGIIVVGWRMTDNPRERTTCFHAINYKVENGKPTFYDTQSRWAEKYNGYTDSSFIRWYCDPREIHVMQTNNLEVSDNVGEAVFSNRRGK